MQGARLTPGKVAQGVGANVRDCFACRDSCIKLTFCYCSIIASIRNLLLWSGG